MPEPARRPSPFLFLILGSPALKLGGAIWLGFGIVGLWTAVKSGPKPDLWMWFMYGEQMTMLLLQTIAAFAAGDFCMAIVDMHRDAAQIRERLERGSGAPPAAAGPAAPPPAPRS